MRGASCLCNVEHPRALPQTSFEFELTTQPYTTYDIDQD